jgi:hypothetical protein
MSAFADQAHTLSEKRSGNDDPYPQVRQAHEEAPWLLANPSEPFGEPGVDFGHQLVSFHAFALALPQASEVIP